jgi:hypothetical protein
LRNHSTSASSGIAQITRAIVTIKGGSARSVARH